MDRPVTDRGPNSISDDPWRAAKQVELATEPDFALGGLRFRPAARQMLFRGRAETLEPRVMQVLAVLARCRGQVVSRDELVRLCWDARAVSDDAINRCIAKIRRVAETHGGFAVETIARVGYRLTEAGPAPHQAPAGPARAGGASLDRRLLLAGGTAAAVASVAAAYFVSRRPDPQVEELLDSARQALREELPHSDQQGVGFLREAVALEPDNAAAWGLLALALRNVAENGDPDETASAVRECQRAARRALALDRREANALAALAVVQPFFGDWLGAEQRLSGVLAVAPDNLAAIGEFTMLLQSVGRCRESWSWNERAASLDPLSPVHQYRRALKHWIFGRVEQADLVIDRALQLWPRHPGVWNARLTIFAFTGRAGAGLAMLEDEATRPPTLEAPSIAFWEASLRALQSGSARDVGKAVETNEAAAPRSPGFANNAIMILSALGELDSAFAVAQGYLLRRGPLIGTLWTGNGQMPVNDHRRRRTMMLFTPAAAPMRADPRFAALCRGIGLEDYWRRRNLLPDHLQAA